MKHLFNFVDDSLNELPYNDGAASTHAMNTFKKERFITAHNGETTYA